MKTVRYALVLVLLCVVSHAHAAANEPHSNMGNVDCGLHYKGTASADPCMTRSCAADKDCRLAKIKNGAPGGLSYGCLTDAKVCGWLWPRPKQ